MAYSRKLPAKHGYGEAKLFPCILFATLGGNCLWRDFYPLELCHARRTIKAPEAAASGTFLAFSTFDRAGGHAFTSDFWATKINSAVGMAESVMAAAMLPHSTAYQG